MLDELEVPGYRGCSLPAEETWVRAISGEKLSGVRRSELQLGHDDLVRFFHRSELLDCLQDALPASVLRLGKACTGYTEAHDNVAVRFSDGSVARGTYMIAADGIHSVIRAQLHKQKAPRYAGYTAWRAVIPFSGGAPAGEYWGQGARFGIFPLTRDRVYWFATHTVPPNQRAPFGERAQLLEIFGRWHPAISALIELTEEEEILRNDIVDREPIESWGRGLVTLLGDAAHPMTPNLGQGACQALEDARALQQAFEETRYIEEALRRYEDMRHKRAHWFVRQSLIAGRMAQANSRWMVAFRNFLALKMPAFVQRRQFERMLRG